jgi:hypothetical protein
MLHDVRHSVRDCRPRGTIGDIMTPRSHPQIPGALSRRLFLRQLALVGAGGALAACSGSPSSSSASQAPAASPSADPGEAAIRAVAPDASNELAVVAATFEQLVDQPNPFVFGLFTLQQEPIEGARAELYAVPAGGEPQGPWPAEPSGADVPPGGLYTVPVEFTATGVHEMVVVTDDGRAGAVAVDVRDTESSVLPAPGQQAQAVATPTGNESLGYERICTRTPEQCGMHEISLDEALAGDTPVVLLFATPAFCQTAVCGPTVDVVEQVRRRGFDDVTFIHCEIFSDAGETLGDPVVAWNLPTEPWMFVIDPGGTIVRRADGPLLVVADEVRTLISDGVAV